MISRFSFTSSSEKDLDTPSKDEVSADWLTSRELLVRASASTDSHDGDPSNPDEELDVKERTRTLVPRQYRVVLHNDDYTTMEFVIFVLRHFFHKADAEATHIMLTVHRKGSGTAGIYSRDVAETKVVQVTECAREHGMPLLLTAEPD